MQKIPPLCPVFSQCGGCQYQDISYQDELKLKEGHLRASFKERLDLPDEIFGSILPSPEPYAYRNRLDLKLMNTKKEGVKVGFSPVNGFRVIEVDHCPIARREISAFIPDLKKQATAKLTPKYRLANLVVRSGEEGRAQWGGMGRRSLTLAPENYFWTQIQGRRIFYSLDTFFQANLFILPTVIETMRSLPIWQKDACFYDLYGGVGLFGIGVSDLVRHVVLIEDSPQSVVLAEYNKEYNKLASLKIIHGKVEEHFGELCQEKISGEKVLMVDPPRAGLSSLMVDLLKTAPAATLLYLSCNPESLVENSEELLKAHWRIRKIIPMDFFPRTRHLETLVLFTRTMS